MGTRPRPRQEATAAAGGDGAWEARTGPRPTQTCSDTPATARLRRGHPLTTLQPIKRQPATVDAVERGGRVTTARQTTTRAVPGCSPPPTCTRCHCTEAAIGRVSVIDKPIPLSLDDPSFIVLTETKFSFRCIPVWDRYSPHLTRVEKKHM